MLSGKLSAKLVMETTATNAKGNTYPASNYYQLCIANGIITRVRRIIKLTGVCKISRKLNEYLFNERRHFITTNYYFACYNSQSKSRELRTSNAECLYKTYILVPIIIIRRNTCTCSKYGYSPRARSYIAISLEFCQVFHLEVTINCRLNKVNVILN